MPVVVGCPKCKTKYQLNESSLGKPIKCKSCQTVFQTKARTKADTRNPSAPAKQRADSASSRMAAKSPRPGQRSQPAAGELAQYGLDGPLKSKSKDLFAGAGSVPSNAPDFLGNFAEETDAGESAVSVASSDSKAKDAGSKTSNELEFLQNPRSNQSPPSKQKGSSARKTPGRGNRVRGQVQEGYQAARIGMWLVFCGFMFLAVVGGLSVVLRLVATLAPSIVQGLPQGVLMALGIVSMIVGIGSLLACLAVLVGQFLCVFSPNKNEKMWAGFSIGGLVAAFVCMLVAAVVVGIFAATATGSGGVNQTAAAGVGLLSLLLFGLALLLILSNMFCFISYFKAVGRNLRSKILEKSAKTAMYGWFGAIAVNVLAFVGLMIFFQFLDRSNPDAPAVALKARQIVGLLTALVNLSVMATLALMSKNGINATVSK